MSIEKERVRQVIDLFSTVYQQLGELAPTYDDDHLVVIAYELARICGNVSLQLRVAIGDEGFRSIDGLANELNRPEEEVLLYLKVELIPSLLKHLEDRAGEIPGEIAVRCQSELAEFKI